MPVLDICCFRWHERIFCTGPRSFDISQKTKNFLLFEKYGRHKRFKSFDDVTERCSEQVRLWYVWIKAAEFFDCLCWFYLENLLDCNFCNGKYSCRTFFIFPYFCLMRVVDILPDLIREEKIKRSLRESSLLMSYWLKSLFRGAPSQRK